MLLHELKNDPDFQHISARLLVSCSADFNPDEGGLFLLDFQHNTWRKLYTGRCMGMVWAGERLIVTTSENQILAMDKDFRLVSKTYYPPFDFHGVAKWNDHIVMIAETAVNAIGFYEINTFTRVGEIRLNASDNDFHHINDIWLEGRTLFVSMLSLYENWHSNPVGKNGAIVAIDLTGFEPWECIHVNPAEHVIVGNLYMPHTVMVHHGQLAYCNSMSFNAVVGSRPPIQLAGFARGLAITDDAIFIGQSRMRQLLRIPYEFSNCNLDVGIHVYNPELRISRFVPLPAQQLYQILVLDPG